MLVGRTCEIEENNCIANPNICNNGICVNHQGNLTSLWWYWFCMTLNVSHILSHW